MSRPTFTADEIAAVMRVSGDTIRRQVRDGELPKIPGLGKQVRIRREDAEARFGPITDEMVDAALAERGAA